MLGNGSPGTAEGRALLKHTGPREAGRAPGGRPVLGGRRQRQQLRLPEDKQGAQSPAAARLSGSGHAAGEQLCCPRAAGHPLPRRPQGPRLVAGPGTRVSKSRRASAGSVPGPAPHLLVLAPWTRRQPRGHDTHRWPAVCSSSSSGRASLRGCRSPTTTVALRLRSALSFCSASLVASISEEGG